MKFDNHVTPECQKILLKQLKEYEQSFHDMTHEERHLLHMWVRKGNSPYENGDYVCDDNCRPMDFVNTLRFWEDMKECLDALSENDVCYPLLLSVIPVTLYLHPYLYYQKKR